MKRCVQCYPVCIGKISASSGPRTQDPLISMPALNPELPGLLGTVEERMQKLCEL